jgi:hypothetical protein
LFPRLLLYQSVLSLDKKMVLWGRMKFQNLTPLGASHAGMMAMKGRTVYVRHLFRLNPAFFISYLR